MASNKRKDYLFVKFYADGHSEVENMKFWTKRDAKKFASLYRGVHDEIKQIDVYEKIGESKDSES